MLNALQSELFILNNPHQPIQYVLFKCLHMTYRRQVISPLTQESPTFYSHRKRQNRVTLCIFVLVTLLFFHHNMCTLDFLFIAFVSHHLSPPLTFLTKGVCVCVCIPKHSTCQMKHSVACVTSPPVQRSLFMSQQHYLITLHTKKIHTLSFAPNFTINNVTP
jgi:hypothetical protein